MDAKKKIIKRRHKKRGMSESSHKSRRRKSKGFLQEIGGPKKTKDAFNSVAAGAIGGGISFFLEKILNQANKSGKPQMSDVLKAGIHAVGGFVLAYVGYPVVGAGMTAIGVNKALSNVFPAKPNTGIRPGTMNDNALQATNYASELKSLPVVISDNGSVYALNEDGEVVQVSANDLNDNALQEDIYPSYVPN